MGGIGSGRRGIPVGELAARHKDFIAALNRYQSVQIAADVAGISRQWGHKIARRIKWAKGKENSWKQRS